MGEALEHVTVPEAEADADCYHTSSEPLSGVRLGFIQHQSCSPWSKLPMT